MPRAYLTTFDEMLTLRDGSHSTRPIWYSTITGRRTSLLFDSTGVAAPFPQQVPWRKMPLNPVDKGVGLKVAAELAGTARDFSPRSEGEQEARCAYGANVAAEDSEGPHGTREGPHPALFTYGPTEFARTSLELKPLAKVLLNEIAAHPLLTRKELGLLLRAPPRRVQSALTKMMELNLIEAHDSRYLVTDRGQHYLALTAGFGNAVSRYARARGWGKGFESLLRNWKHTEQENKFFLHLAQIAQVRRHTFTWLSELEGRLYYEAGQARHSFLPDGRGSYVAGDEHYEFAVEIDRSKSSQVRFRRKLAEYEACVSSNVLRSEGIELLRVLVITNSWERADTWRRAAREARLRFPIYVTTFDRLYASGADAPVWLRIDQADVKQSAAVSPKVYCFECFGRIAKQQLVPSRST
jgi:hypothetical protein